MSDRFDLEQQIMKCWCVVDDLKVLAEAYSETEMSEDDVLNLLLGMSALYHMHFEKCFSLFEEVICETGTLQRPSP